MAPQKILGGPVMHLAFRFYNKILLCTCSERKALSIMRYQDDINTEHNMNSICRAEMAQWTKRLTRNKQTRV